MSTRFLDYVAFFYQNDYQLLIINKKLIKYNANKHFCIIFAEKYKPF